MSDPTPFSEPAPGEAAAGAAAAGDGAAAPVAAGPDANESAELAPGGSDPTTTPFTEAPAAPPAASGRAPKQTLAGRVWIALGFAAILLVLIIIFIAENSRSITISFLGAHGHISLALALLIAVVAGIGITLLVGSARIVQLTLEVRRHRRKIRQLS